MLLYSRLDLHGYDDAEYDRPAHKIVDHRTWVVVGDGCQMGGYLDRGAWVACTLRLGK